jgi:tetratricopeptide (TPR) repeat protein
LRAELADRRVLVLLDDAASSDQVSPLLPPTAGCLALVTSRRRLVDLDGARPRSIETLCREDAVALLALVAGERVHDEPAAAAEVATRCGHLPLALRLAGARLAHRPRWRVQDLANRLSDTPTPLAELTAADRTVADAFALSYAHLTPAAQRLFRLLGLHPGEHFAANAAAALADTSLADSRRLLDELADAHLVEEPYRNRYRYHDLVKAYALQLSESTDRELDRQQAIRHLLDYYLHSAATAGAELEAPTGRQGFELDAAARPELVDGHDRGWLETERSNLIAATRSAAALGELRYAWQIARAMWKFLLLRCYLDDLVETHRCGLASAEGLSEPAAAVMMRNGLASAYFQRGDYDEAVEQVRHIVAWREKTDDLVGAAIARKNLAVTYAMDGQAAQAIEHIERALATARRSGNHRLLALTVANAGFVYGTIGRHALALHHSRRSLALAREVGDRHLVAIVLGNIGTHRARLGEPGPALRLLTTALALKRRFGNRPGEAETLRDIGMAYRMLGRLDDAADYHGQALTVMRDIGDRPGESTIYNEFGETLRTAGSLTSALGMHRRALELATKIRHRYNQARALDGIAACLRDTDPDTARRHWLRALELYEELGAPDRNEVEYHLSDLGESR